MPRSYLLRSFIFFLAATGTWATALSKAKTALAKMSNTDKVNLVTGKWPFCVFSASALIVMFKVSVGRLVHVSETLGQFQASTV